MNTEISTSKNLSEKKQMNFQHREKHNEAFLTIFNNVAELQTTDKNEHSLNEVILQLENFANTELLQSEYFLYQSQHTHFISRVNQFKTELNYNNPYLGKNIFIFLKKWYLTHIVCLD